MKIVANKLEKNNEIVYSFKMTELTAQSLFQNRVDVPNKKIEISFSLPLSSERMKLIQAYVDKVLYQIENNEYLNHLLTYKKLEIALKLAEFYKKYPNGEKFEVNSFFKFVCYGATSHSLFSTAPSLDILKKLVISNNNQQDDLNKLLALYHEAYSLESEAYFTVVYPVMSPPSINYSLVSFFNPHNDDYIEGEATASFGIPGGRLGYIVTSLVFDTLEENANVDKYKEKLIKSLGNKFEKPETMNQYLFRGDYREPSLTPVRNVSSSGVT